MSTVVCLVEHDDEGLVEASRRALTVARDFAVSCDANVHVVAIGAPSPGARTQIGEYGGAVAHVVDPDAVGGFAPTAWARVLGQVVDDVGARAVLAAGSDRGSEVLAHLAAQRTLPMVANCVTVTSTNDTGVAVTRLRWAGSLLEDSTLDSPVAVLTVAFDGVISAPANTPTELEMRTANPTLDEGDLDVRVTEWTKRPGGISLAEARVVVGGGRGVGSVENFAALDELAELLGAAVGVSRVVTSLGWRAHSQQVGQTGTRISPDLYLAAGISGATQHLAGCQSAKVVVAINTDGDAPIVTRADYAVVGDLNEIIPALVEAIRSR